MRNTKYLEKAFEGKNQWWRYPLLFLAAIIAGNTILMIPLGIILGVKSATTGEEPDIEKMSEMSSDLTAFGLSSNLTLVIMISTFIVCLAFFLLLFKSMHKRPVQTLFSASNKIRVKRLLSAFFVWFMLCVVYLIIDYNLDPENFKYNLDLSSFIPLIIISICLIPLQAAFEEITFRGYFAQGIAVWTKNRWLVLIIPAILFSLMHSINPEVGEFGFLSMMPQYVTFGIVFGLCVILDEGIEVAIGAHAANNVFSSIFVTHKSSVLQTSALFEQGTVNPQKELIVLIIMSTVFILIFSYIYKWDFKILNKKVIAPKINKDNKVTV